MHVIEANGHIGVITKWVVVAGQATMYNLTVAHDHTYAVGVGQWVVHNANCTEIESKFPGDYLAKKSPKYVTPGTRVLNGQYVNDLGEVENWTAHYDEYGRQIGRTDYTRGNPKANIPPAHYHVYEYNQSFPQGHSIGDHIPGEFIP